jgi:hypothetical protein
VRVEYHPAVEEDVTEALQRYDAVSQKPGEEFKADFGKPVRGWLVPVNAL